jgi:hypothetical protein
LRLRRIAEQLMAQEDLLQSTVQEVYEEAAPLRTLLDRQSSAMETVKMNLVRRLAPVRDFAAREESNLRALEEQINGDGMSFVAHAFAETLEEQRTRISATRSHMESQREPFERFAADEGKAVESALKRFDADIDALEDAIAEQRKVTLRLLTGMRSENFREVCDFLLLRQEALEEVAESGATDPSEIAGRLEAVLGEQRPRASENAHLRAVLEEASGIDARLAAAGTGASVRALVRPLHPTPEEDADSTGNAEARPAA